MRTKDNEFQAMLCRFYMAVILCVLPLYTQGTYVQLGDTKYLLFRNVSFICVGLWLAAELLCLVQKIIAGKKGADRVQIAGGIQKQGRAWSMMDTCMAAYGGSAFLSAALSSYERTAWLGYRDWYMGAISQLLFVAIYFMVSRSCCNGSFLIYLGECAMLLVCSIAFLQRLGIDVLGLHKAYNEIDWEYRHMLSTVGNINWLCGYLSVAIAFSVSAYLQSEERRKRIGHFIASVAGLLLLCIQGSDIGWALCAICIGICIVWGRKNIIFLQRNLLLAAGTVFGIGCFAGLVFFMESVQAMPADGDVYEKISWAGWWAVLAILMILFCLLRRRGNLGEAAVRKLSAVGKVWYVALPAGVCLTVCFILFTGLTGRNGILQDFWQEGRGALWKLAGCGFLKADILQKLVGAGPDCFAEYLHNGFRTSTVINTNGHWAGVTFANAHNEWLNHLVNMGILGVICYAGIFVTAMKRYRGMLLGMLAVGLYFVNSLVSFQQVMNAPLLFLVLGFCENKRQTEPSEDLIL